MTASMPSDRRQHRRCPLNWPGTLHAGGASVALDVVDISAGGAKLSLPLSFEDPGAVVLQIDRIGSFLAEIVWQDGDGAGVRFLDELNKTAA
jgi:hypothetical protein